MLRRLASVCRLLSAFFKAAEHRFEKPNVNYIHGKYEAVVESPTLSDFSVGENGNIKQPDFIDGKCNFDMVARIVDGKFIWTKVYLS